MKRGYSRMERISDQLQRELSLLITKANDPRFQTVSITGVDVSPNMANANVYFSVLDEAILAEIQTALNHAAGFLRSELAHAINLKTTPKLRFVYDNSITHGNRLSTLIDAGIKKTEE